jgi:hypothetical protein
VVKATVCSVCVVVVVVDVETESVTVIVGCGSPVGLALHVGALAIRAFFLSLKPFFTRQVQVTQLGWMVVAEQMVLVIVRGAGVIVVVVLVVGV